MAKFPTPTRPGHFWAKQKLTDSETETPSGEWEVVQVFDHEYDGKTMRVFVPGMGESEPTENFFWGPEVTLPAGLA